MRSSSCGSRGARRGRAADLEHDERAGLALDGSTGLGQGGLRPGRLRVDARSARAARAHRRAGRAGDRAVAGCRRDRAWKANAPDLAIRWNTISALFGATLNPRDHSRSAGGSTGGDAAASPRAWRRSGSAPTTAARSACRRRSARSSGCGRQPAWCRERRSSTDRRPTVDGPDAVGRASGAHDRRSRACARRAPRAGAGRPGRSARRAAVRTCRTGSCRAAPRRDRRSHRPRRRTLGAGRRGGVARCGARGGRGCTSGSAPRA